VPDGVDGPAVRSGQFRRRRHELRAGSHGDWPMCSSVGADQHPIRTVQPDPHRGGHQRAAEEGRQFLPGKPTDPPRAGTTATTVMSTAVMSTAVMSTAFRTAVSGV